MTLSIERKVDEKESNVTRESFTFLENFHKKIEMRDNTSAMMRGVTRETLEDIAVFGKCVPISGGGKEDEVDIVFQLIKTKRVRKGC